MHPDDVDELSNEIDLSASPRKAEELEQVGAGLAEDEYGRATFYGMAAEHRLMDGDLDAAERDLRLGGEGHEGELLLHPLTTWLSWAQKSQRPEEVERILGELIALWRADKLTISSAHHVGELLEMADDLKRAHRWFTLPLAHLDPDEDFDWDEEMCLMGRARVRRDLGLQRDRYDVAAAEIIAANKRRASQD